MSELENRPSLGWVERNPLVAALVLSLLIHLMVYGTWQVGKHFGWWKHNPAWLTQLSRLLVASPAKARQPQPIQQATSIPMTFVEVDPETATAEAPKEAKYYSSQNSKAANPEPKKEEEVKVDGKQSQVVRLMENEKPKAFPLQPSPPKPPPEEPPQPEPKPKVDPPGDLALVKPKETRPSDARVDTTTPPQNPKPPEPKERPRTLAAARAQKGLLSGQPMRQSGGVSSRGKVAFDAKATPFGDYDRDFIAAVEQCWHILLDNHTGSHGAGKVVVDFRLTYDGRITDIKISENEVGPILSMLCQSAILNPQPYPRWPAQMRQTIGGNSREIRFTFYYN